MRTAGAALGFVVAGLIGLCALSSHDAVAADGALKIGTVDLKRVAAESQMGKGRARDLESAIKDKNAEIEQEREALKKLLEELKLLDVASEEASHKRRIVTERAALLKAKDALAASELQLKRAAAYRDVYTEIFAVLESFRKANGFSLLLRKDNMDLTELPPVSVMALLRSNAVLASDPAMEVTDQIIKLMDEKHGKK